MCWADKRFQALNDEELYDVHLVGTDGGEVPCSKAILATIIPFFKKMFYGGFIEAKTDRCNLAFHSLVISVIIKYCYIGQLDLDLIFSKDITLEEEAILLVDLHEAGRFFDIDELSSAAEAKIGDLVFRRTDNKRYDYASAVLTELYKRGEDDKGPLWGIISGFAADNAMKCFGPRTSEKQTTTDTSYYHSHPTVLSSVLQSTKNTYDAVRCIKAWVSLESKSAGNDYSDEEKRDLLKLAEDIDLKDLDTNELANIQPCSLFPSERILEAFVHHCKKTDDSPKETPSTETGRLFVSGAEMEYLNGYYSRFKYGHEIVDVYHKRVQHNGKDHVAVIHYKHRQSKWMISIARMHWDFINSVDGVCEVNEDFICMDLYEAPGQSTSTDVPRLPPLNSWKCCKGEGPVPFVACNM